MTDKSPPRTSSLGFGLTAKPARRGTRTKSRAPERKARILLVTAIPTRAVSCPPPGASNYAVESVDSAEAALDAAVRSRPIWWSPICTGRHGRTALLRELKSRWPAITVIISPRTATHRAGVRATQFSEPRLSRQAGGEGQLLARFSAPSTIPLRDGGGRIAAKIVPRSQPHGRPLGLPIGPPTTTCRCCSRGKRHREGASLPARFTPSPRREEALHRVHCKDAREERWKRSCPAPSTRRPRSC